MNSGTMKSENVLASLYPKVAKCLFNILLISNWSLVLTLEFGFMMVLTHLFFYFLLEIRLFIPFQACFILW